MTTEFTLPETRLQTRELDSHRRFLVNKVRNPYLALPTLERKAVITPVIEALTSDIGFTAEFLRRHIGDGRWEHRPEALSYLKPIEIARGKEQYLKDSAVLWLWLAFADHEYLSHVEKYIELFDSVALRWGVFTIVGETFNRYPPPLEKVADQRQIPFKLRQLAADIIFIRDCIEHHSFPEAGQNTVNLISLAYNEYLEAELAYLQQAIVSKSLKLRQGKFLDELKKHGIWDKKEKLAMMCVDHALRDLVLRYYGVVRGVKGEGGRALGYEYGQNILNIMIELELVRKTI